MPRTALYDVSSILDQAVDIFLEHSFHGAKMDEIIARTGFNRRGFYLEFGSKQDFLYKVIAHYQQTQLEPILTELEADQGLGAISTFFLRYIQLVHKKGCLLINSISELGRQDDTIREIGRHYLDRLQFDFIGCLEKAQRSNEVAQHINIEAAALQLTSYVQGFAINAILAESVDELHIATQSLLSPLHAD